MRIYVSRTLLWCFLSLCALCIPILSVRINSSHVIVYHIIDNDLWGQIDGSYLKGTFPCPFLDFPIQCEVLSSDTAGHPSNATFFDIVVGKYLNDYHSVEKSKKEIYPLTVGLYNIHTWKALSPRPYKPNSCRLPTHLSMAESEESFGRFGHLFRTSFVYYDGNSTINPSSSVPRSYVSSINITSFLPLKQHHDLIPAAAYVASTCHQRADKRSMSRDDIVALMRSLNIRVDGLGRCSRTTEPQIGLTNHPKANDPSIKLSHGKNALESLEMKQKAISNYMFYLAFENTIEAGYVSEKVFDGLISGSVPIYLGSMADCKALIPMNKAVIYIDDFVMDSDKDMRDRIIRLTDYMKYLMNNSTAYNEHRFWRQSFDIEKMSPLLHQSWPCRICEWAHNKASTSDLARSKSHHCG